MKYNKHKRHGMKYLSISATVYEIQAFYINFFLIFKHIKKM